MIRRLLGRTLGRVSVWVYVTLSMIPLLFIVVTSVKPQGYAQAVPPIWNFTPTFEHYALVFSGGGGASAFRDLITNSAIVTTGATALTVALAIPAAYALTMQQFRQRRFMGMWILSTYMFPPIVAVVPFFIMAGRLDVMDTYLVLIIPYVGFNLPIAIWILRGAILQIPREIEEAAMVDGLGQVGVLRKIILPLTMPAVVTAAMLTAILSWNEFLFALSLTRRNAKTAPVGVMEFTGMFGTQWEALTAASMIIVAPILIMTLILRRRLVSGLALGAID